MTTGQREEACQGQETEGDLAGEEETQPAAWLPPHSNSSRQGSSGWSDYLKLHVLGRPCALRSTQQPPTDCVRRWTLILFSTPAVELPLTQAKETGQNFVKSYIELVAEHWSLRRSQSPAKRRWFFIQLRAVMIPSPASRLQGSPVPGHYHHPRHLHPLHSHRLQHRWRHLRPTTPSSPS
jgi:hypothetical protein